jgi:hypothetical protein
MLPSPSVSTWVAKICRHAPAPHAPPSRRHTPQPSHAALQLRLYLIESISRSYLKHSLRRDGSIYDVTVAQLQPVKSTIQRKRQIAAGQHARQSPLSAPEHLTTVSSTLASTRTHHPLHQTTLTTTICHSGHKQPAARGPRISTAQQRRAGRAGTSSWSSVRGPPWPLEPAQPRPGPRPSDAHTPHPTAAAHRDAQRRGGMCAQYPRQGATTWIKQASMI